jgi:response regulator of citrate/malate metabolism
MNCYLIEDEQHAIDLLEDYLSRLENFCVVGSNLNAKHALAEIEKLNNVDLVFTDIYMPDLSGFDVISRLPKHIQTVVTTVNSYYRQGAADLNAAGFLLKPFDFATFQNTVLPLSKKK